MIDDDDDRLREVLAIKRLIFNQKKANDSE